LRGDPYLWKAMELELTKLKNPQSLAEFNALLQRLFRDITGHTLKAGEQLFVEKFNHGGMSGGYISCDFWIESGFPQLMSAFNTKILLN
jgi:hypothetical protein